MNYPVYDPYNIPVFFQNSQTRNPAVGIPLACVHVRFILKRRETPESPCVSIYFCNGLINFGWFGNLYFWERFTFESHTNLPRENSQSIWKSHPRIPLRSWNLTSSPQDRALQFCCFINPWGDIVIRVSENTMVTGKSTHLQGGPPQI